MKSYAVIGAGYGDEGKGLITDYLVRKHKVGTVVRFNGGAQAGHTVVDGNRRHVFSHFGAGTLAGADTHLSSKFLVNFHRLREESMQLKSMDVNPIARLHPCARVTTIFDIMINRMLEDSRGENRQGSCGLGINETIVRSGSHILEVGDCLYLTRLSHILFRIKHVWVPKRLEELGISTEENLEKIDLIDIMELAYFYQSMVKFYASTDAECPRNVVFEGAQGLFIDAELGVFPHVTPTEVGIGQAMLVASEVALAPIQPVYVSRPYFTRHGAGPLDHEGEHITNSVLYDHTNEPNEYQGVLRYAPLDVGAMARKIRTDMGRRGGNVNVFTPVLALTHLDQLGASVSVYNDSKRHDVETDKLVEFIEEKTGIPVKYCAFGPEAKDVIERKETE